MTGQRWPNALFDKEWLQHYLQHACWTEDVRTASKRSLAMTMNREQSKILSGYTLKTQRRPNDKNWH